MPLMATTDHEANLHVVVIEKYSIYSNYNTPLELFILFKVVSTNLFPQFFIISLFDSLGSQGIISVYFVL